MCTVISVLLILKTFNINALNIFIKFVMMCKNLLTISSMAFSALFLLQLKIPKDVMHI